MRTVKINLASFIFLVSGRVGGLSLRRLRFNHILKCLWGKHWSPNCSWCWSGVCLWTSMGHLHRCSVLSFTSFPYSWKQKFKFCFAWRSRDITELKFRVCGLLSGWFSTNVCEFSLPWMGSIVEEQAWLTQIPASVMERMSETRISVYGTHTVQLCAEGNLGSDVEKTGLWAERGKDSESFCADWRGGAVCQRLKL